MLVQHLKQLFSLIFHFKYGSYVLTIIICLIMWLIMNIIYIHWRIFQLSLIHFINRHPNSLLIIKLCHFKLIILLLLYFHKHMLFWQHHLIYVMSLIFIIFIIMLCLKHAYHNKLQHLNINHIHQFLQLLLFYLVLHHLNIMWNHIIFLHLSYNNLLLLLDDFH